MTGRNLQTWLDGPLTAQLDRITRRRAPRLPAPQVLVTAPGVRFAAGDVDRPFHTASVGKVFTAVLVGRLVELGRFALDTPVGAVLPADEVSALPAATGVDFSREVTIEHLLSHKSGLPDPLDPPRGYRTACSIKSLTATTDRYWTLPEVLAETSTLPPTGAPGQRFAYSDAGYAVLLRVAEEVAGEPAADLLHTHVFAPSGMTHTHQPQVAASSRADRDGTRQPADDRHVGGHSAASAHTDPTDPDISPMWLGRAEMSRTPALSIGSIDGGALTTLNDLVRFQQALHGGALISSALLDHLSRPRSRLRAGIWYGAGLVTLRFAEFMPLVLRGLPEPVGGLGLTATHAYYYPAQQAHVVLNFHTTEAMSPSFRVHIQIARRLGEHAAVVGSR